MEVARLNITPVKSTRLHHPTRVMLNRTGAEGDRRFFLVDSAGRRFSRATSASFIPVVSEYDSSTDVLTLRLPDGREVSGSAAPTKETIVVDFFGRPVPAHIVGGEFCQALSGLIDQQVRLARPDRVGDAFDVQPVTLVSCASVQELARRGGRSDGRLDGGRFRMTVEIEGAEYPHEEDSWEGRLLRLGDALVRIRRPVQRCVITTLDPHTGQADFPTLKVIKGYRGVVDRGLLFGMYGEVVVPGSARIGDPVELAD